MAFIPAANTAQVVFKQTLHGNVVQNVFHVLNETGWSPAELTALADAIILWANDNYSSNLSTDLQFVSVACRDMTVEDGAGVEVAFPALSGGELAFAALPGNVALAVKFKTGFTGRNRNGRWFVAGLTEGNVTGNVINDVNKNLILEAFGDLRTQLLALGYAHVIASFYNGTHLVEYPDGQIKKRPTARATALITTVETYLADSNTDSQRRRLNGRGV